MNDKKPCCENNPEQLTNSNEENGCGCGCGCAENSATPVSPAIKANRKICHCYYEVGGDLLAKPNALCDILEARGLPNTLIFCNSPSDTDFVEVLLKKRGIGATKLIGYVPPAKLQRTLERLQSREISAIVLTDIAARGMDLNAFDLTINYSIPQDPDIYLHRCGVASVEKGQETQLSTTASGCTPENCRTVTSIISPLDITGFHNLRKVVALNFEQGQLPTKESLLASRSDNLRQKALAALPTLSEEIRLFAHIILENQERESIVALLLHNTLEVIPQLNANLDKAAWDREYGEEEGEVYEGRGRERDRGERRGRGRRDEREEREERGDRRGRRDRRRGGRREEERYAEEEFAEGQNRGEREEQQRRQTEPYESEERPAEGEVEYEREARPEREPRVREDRLYIGQGTTGGLSEESLNEICEKQGVARELIKRFTIRGNYAFLDVPAEDSSAVIEKLAQGSLGSEPLFVKKAVTISAPRERKFSRAEDGGEEAGPEGEEPAQENDGSEGQPEE